MRVILTHHGIEDLFLVHRLSRELRRILLLVLEGEGLGLGDGGRVPGGMMGRVRVEGCVISSCVHMSDSRRERVRDCCRTVDTGNIESGQERSYMERFDAGRTRSLGGRKKRKRFRYVPRGESATLLPPE